MQAVTASTSDESAPWYENLPAVAMDYKIHIDPGKEDCFFQYVNPGATFYVNFQVSNVSIELLIMSSWLIFNAYTWNVCFPIPYL